MFLVNHTGEIELHSIDNLLEINSPPITGTSEKYLKYLSIEARCIFFVVFMIILLVAIIGNVFAIITTYKRKHRFIQKALIISLAVSDMFTATIYSINNMETFSHPLINWTLGSFMCSFIPVAQTCGVIISSALLVGIGIDRYNNVVNALNKKFDPDYLTCIGAICCLILISSVFAYPMAIFFEIKRVNVLFLDETGKIPLYIDKLELCLSDAKGDLMMYYICLVIIIFIPIVTMFVWLYWNIAHLVWVHRKPFSSRYKQDSESSTTGDTTTSTNMKSCTSNTKDLRTKMQITHLKTAKSIHVERKIRTFKVIVFLMSVFIVCRGPYWVLTMYKLTVVMREPHHWILVFSLNALNLLNSALNPFVYTFLNASLDMVKRVAKSIGNFVGQICCCCLTNAEFEEFEKENPFLVEKFEKCQVAPKSSNSPEVLRKSKRSAKVKFDNKVQDKY